MLGSLLTARRIGRGRVAEILLGGNLVIGLALLVVAVSVATPLQVGAAFVAGIAQSMVLVTYITLRTAYSPDDLLGRIGSTARTISLGLQPIGLLVGGALIDLTSGSATIAIIGVAVAADQPRLRPDRGDAARNGDAEMRQVLGSLRERVRDRAADDLDADGATRALELVALGDLDGGRTGAPWAFDVEHH